MLAESYFYLSFSEITGILIAVISVALVVKQLNDTRLATQMAGFLSMSDQFSNIVPAIEFIDSLSSSEEWKSLDGPAAFQYLIGDTQRRAYYKSVAAFYETMAALLRRGSLDKKLVVDTYGDLVVKRWLIVQKAAFEHRVAMGVNSLYEQWEWMANYLRT